MAGYLPQNRGNKSTSRPGPAVSRRLRRMGWNISPSARRHDFDGIFVVAQGDRVTIQISSGDMARNVDSGADLAQDLTNMVGMSRVTTWQSPDTGTVFVAGTYTHPGH